MGKNHDAIKAALSRKPVVKAEALPGETFIPLPPPNPPVTGTANGDTKVIYRCGHSEPLKVFTHGDCPACRNKAREAKEQEKAAKRTQQFQARTTGDEGRLPEGSGFTMTYNAEKKQWFGTLRVGDRLFDSASGGVFKLLQILDRMYRDSLATGVDAV